MTRLSLLLPKRVLDVNYDDFIVEMALLHTPLTYSHFFLSWWGKKAKVCLSLLENILIECAKSCFVALIVVDWIISSWIRNLSRAKSGFSSFFLTLNL